MRDGASRPSPQVDLLAPLADYYSTHGESLPPIRIVTATDLSERHWQLLAHDNDMTPTLEAFYGQALELRIHSKHLTNATLERVVSLIGCGDGRPVEFGAIRIQLDAFSDDVRAVICACRTPLGAILRDHRIDHVSKPTAFFTIESDDVIQAALAPHPIPGGTHLYGRHNELADTRGRRFAQVVEILPPLRETP